MNSCNQTEWIQIIFSILRNSFNELIKQNHLLPKWEEMNNGYTIWKGHWGHTKHHHSPPWMNFFLNEKTTADVERKLFVWVQIIISLSKTLNPWYMESGKWKVESAKWKMCIRMRVTTIYLIIVLAFHVIGTPWKFYICSALLENTNGVKVFPHFISIRSPNWGDFSQARI